MPIMEEGGRVAVKRQACEILNVKRKKPPIIGGFLFDTFFSKKAVCLQKILFKGFCVQTKPVG